jgi:hypothetical protein
VKKETKKHIVHYIIIAILVVIIIFLLFMKGCSTGSSGGGLILGGGGSSGGNSVDPLNCDCPSGFTFDTGLNRCNRDPCPSGWTYTQPTVAYTNGNCLPPTGTPTTTRACSDIVNPLSQRDCDVGTCSYSGQFCYFYPAQSGTTYVPARCGC